MTPTRFGITLLVATCAALGCPPPTPASRCAGDDDCPLDYECSTLAHYCLARNAAGHDAAGRDAAGRDAAGHDAAGHDSAGQDAAGHDSAGQDAAGHDAAAGDAAADAGSVDHVVAPAGCSTTGSYQDDFDDGVADAFWEWGDGSGSSHQLIDGAFRIDFAASGTTPGYSGLTSAYAVDLRESALTIQLVNPIDAIDTAFANLSFYSDSQNMIGFAQEMSGLNIEYKVDGVPSGFIIDAVPIAEMSWWRLREPAGRVYFDTSPNGVTWTNRHSAVDPWFVDHGQIDIMAGTWGVWSSADTVIFDNLNTGQPRAPWCPVSSLRDDFGDADFGAHWTLVERTGCRATESGTAMHIVNPDLVQQTCRIESRRVFSLDPSGALVHLVRVPAQDQVEAGLYLYRDDLGLWWEWGAYNGLLYAYGEQHYVQTFVRHTEPVGDYSWLRMRRLGNDLLFEASGSGGASDWTTIYTATPDIALDAVRVGLEVWVGDNTLTPDAAYEGVFDRFNLPP